MRLSVTLVLSLHLLGLTRHFARHARVDAAFRALKRCHSRVDARFVTALRCVRVLHSFLRGKVSRSCFRSVRSCSSRSGCHARVFARFRFGPSVMLAIFFAFASDSMNRVVAFFGCHSASDNFKMNWVLVLLFSFLQNDPCELISGQLSSSWFCGGSA